MNTPTARAGTAVFVKIATRDATVFPMAQADPSGGVRLTLIDPLGATAVFSVPMVKVGVGLYELVYQTTPTSALGPWYAEATATEGAVTYKSPRMIAFELA